MKTSAPEQYHFKDDGKIPNSHYPVLLYRNAITEHGNEGAEWMEKRFAENNWTNSWRWGIYPFHHYHSNTHEVLGVFSGTAALQLGGEKGEELQVEAGDILILPAGTGHKCISSSKDFEVVGAYPEGREADLNNGKDGERPKVDEAIANVPKPEKDPLLGKGDGLSNFWK